MIIQASAIPVVAGDMLAGLDEGELIPLGTHRDEARVPTVSERSRSMDSVPAERPGAETEERHRSSNRKNVQQTRRFLALNK